MICHPPVRTPDEIAEPKYADEGEASHYVGATDLTQRIARHMAARRGLDEERVVLFRRVVPDARPCVLLATTVVEELEVLLGTWGGVRLAQFLR